MINFKQEELIDQLMRHITEKFPEVRLIDVTESPEDPKLCGLMLPHRMMRTG